MPCPHEQSLHGFLNCESTSGWHLELCPKAMSTLLYYPEVSHTGHARYIHNLQRTNQPWRGGRNDTWDNSWAFPLINNWLHAKHNHGQELGLPMFRGSVRVFGVRRPLVNVNSIKVSIQSIGLYRGNQDSPDQTTSNQSYFFLYIESSKSGARDQSRAPCWWQHWQWRCGQHVDWQLRVHRAQPRQLSQPLFPHLSHAATNRRIVFFNSNHNCWNIMHLCTASSFQSSAGKF